MFLGIISPREDDILRCVALELIKCHAKYFSRRCAPFGCAPYIVELTDFVCTQLPMFRWLHSNLHNIRHRLKIFLGNLKTLDSICSLFSTNLSGVQGISHVYLPAPIVTIKQI